MEVFVMIVGIPIILWMFYQLINDKYDFESKQ